MKLFDNYECDFIKRRLEGPLMFIKISSESKMFNTVILFYYQNFISG